MSSQMEISKDTLPEYDASIIPCSLQHNGGLTDISLFRNSTERSVYMKKEVEVRFFRGLKFIGQTIDMDGKVPYVIKPSEIIETDGEINGLSLRKQFLPVARLRKIRIFGHDDLPATSNKWLLAREWECFADVIHSS